MLPLIAAAWLDSCDRPDASILSDADAASHLLPHLICRISSATIMTQFSIEKYPYRDLLSHRGWSSMNSRQPIEATWMTPAMLTRPTPVNLRLNPSHLSHICIDDRRSFQSAVDWDDPLERWKWAHSRYERLAVGDICWYSHASCLLLFAGSGQKLLVAALRK